VLPLDEQDVSILHNHGANADVGTIGVSTLVG
jgi:hypothetical protein